MRYGIKISSSSSSFCRFFKMKKKNGFWIWLIACFAYFCREAKKELLLDAKQGNEILNYNLLGSS